MPGPSIRRSALGLCAIVVVAGCNKTEVDPPAASPSKAAQSKASDEDEAQAEHEAEAKKESKTPSEEGATVARLLDQVGDGPVVAFVVRPDQWPATRDAVLPMVRGVPGGVDVAAMAGSVEKLVAFAGQGADMKLDELEGVDWTRPIVGGLGDPPPFEPLLVPKPGAGHESQRDLGLHHVVFVPVSDGEAFLQTVPKALRFQTLPSWSSESSWTGRKTDAYAHAAAEGDYARIDLFVDVTGIDDAQAETLLAPRAKADSQPLAKTPALAALTSDDSLLAVHVRPWRLRSFTAWWGRNNLVRALDQAPPEMRATMMAKGLSIVLTGEMFMTDAGAEFDDWTWMLSAGDKQANLRAVGSLTPHGRKAFDAASADVALLGSKDKDAPVTASVRIDLDAALEAVEPPITMKDFKRPSHVAQAFQECGVGCLVHAVTRSPLQNVEMLIRVLTDGASMGAIKAAQGIVTSYSPPAGAVALLHPSEAEAGKTQAAIAAMAGSGVPLEQATRGSDHIVMLGLGTKTAEVFSMTEESSSSLLEASVSGHGSGTPLNDMRGSIRLQRRGPALVADIAVAKGTDPKLAYEPRFDGVAWDSPVLSFPGADEAECLGRVVLAIRNSFEAVAMVAADQRATVLAKGINEVEQKDACAGGSPEAQKKANELTDMAKALLDAVDEPPDPETP